MANNLSDSPNDIETNDAKVLLIGVTGGTGSNVVKGFLEQNSTNLRAITRQINLQSLPLAKLNNLGVELVEADLDDEASLEKALVGVSSVYCHAFAPDSTKPDPQEIARAKRFANVAKQAKITHLVYNSAGGVDRQSGISHIEQKYKIEQVLKQAGLPTTMLRACLFMEEFWKKYTRPSILKGVFSFSLQPDRPLHLITTKDMGRVAAYAIKHQSKYVDRAIELAGDVLTPTQMTAEFSRVQGKPVTYKEIPPWIFLLFWRKSLFDLIQWYRHEGYQADVQYLRDQEFPKLLTSFREFLEETNWANEMLTYQDI
ncbi:MAG: NmrA/HSCARG family protein [Waterburya sp.]